MGPPATAPRARHRAGRRARPGARRAPPDEVAAHLRRDARRARPGAAPAVRRPRDHAATTGLLPAAEVAPLRDWFARAGRRRRARAAVVRQHPRRRARQPRAPADAAARRAAAASRSTPRSGCAPTPTRAYDGALARRRRGAARRHRCCAARCWPAGRSSSAPASCCARCRPGSAGCATGSRGDLRGTPAQVEPRRPRRWRRASRRCSSTPPRRAAERADDAWRGRAAGRRLARPAGRTATSAGPSPELRAARRARRCATGRARARPGAPRGRAQRTTARIARLRRQRTGLVAHGRGVRQHRAASPAPRSASPAARRASARRCSRRVFGDQAVRRLADAGPRGPARPGRRAAGRRGAARFDRPARRARPPTPATRRRAWTPRGAAVEAARSDAPPGRRAEQRLTGRGPTCPRGWRRCDEAVELGRGPARPGPAGPRARAVLAGPASGCGCRGPHRRRAGRADRQRQVDAVQRPGRSSTSASRGAAADDLATAAARAGARTAGPLLDWLEVPRRHRQRATAGPDGPAGPRRWSGLVLLDLPDHDSTEVAHRLEVDRLVALVDVLVWVLDPQKYADAAVHDRYLRPLARHGDVMRRGAQPGRPAAADGRADLAGRPAPAARRRRARRACRCCRVGRTGDGLDRLRDVLTGASPRTRGGGAPRLAADVDTVTAGRAGRRRRAAARPRRRRAGHGAQRASSSPRWPGGRRARRWARRRSARPCTGPSRRRAVPSLRWLRRLRPDPLRRLHLDRPARAVRAGRADVPAAPSGRPCPPPAPWSGRGWTWRCAGSPTTLRGPARPVAGRAARRRPVTRGRPGRLAGPGRRHHGSRGDPQTDLVAGGRPAAGAARGDGRGGRVVAGRALRAPVLRLPEPEPPQVGIVPLPTVLLIGGLLAGGCSAGSCSACCVGCSSGGLARRRARRGGTTAPRRRRGGLRPVGRGPRGRGAGGLPRHPGRARPRLLTPRPVVSGRIPSPPQPGGPSVPRPVRAVPGPRAVRCRFVVVRPPRAAPAPQ